MRLMWRDLVATVLVVAAVGLYAVWLSGANPGGILDARIVAAVVLGLGVLASLSAVVPGFGELLRGSRVYLAITSVLGLVALVGGILTLVDASETALATLVAATAVLWLCATVRHSVAQRGQSAEGDERSASGA